MTLLTIIGRGHSGTRAMSHTLYASGVFMGTCLNRSGDMIPPGDMYEACRVMARYVQWKGDLEWDFSNLHDMEIPEEFTRLVRSYLRSVLAEHERYPDRLAGWKIPETTLVYPWIVRMFPDMKYIFWIRDPRDSILASHKTDDLADFGVPYPPTDDIRLSRAISWKYQYDIVKATPKPCTDRSALRGLRDQPRDHPATFGGVPRHQARRIIVRPDLIQRWKTTLALRLQFPRARHAGVQIHLDRREHTP